jgi:hypothetical protein
MSPIFLLHCLIATAYGLATRADGRESVPVARPIDARTTISRNSGRSVVQDETVCHGITGDYWVMSRDTIIENVRLFCGQDALVMRYNEDTVNELVLEVKNWNAGTDMQSPKDAPDCIDRFQDAVIDGCDGNDMLNNPYNYKFGATLRTTDGWQFKMTPWSKQINEVTCDISYKVGYNWIEVRGKNLPSALMGANGEGLRKELSGCGGLTGWKFEQTPGDRYYQWYAVGALPFGKKSCVGRAIQSAGGSSNGGCKRDTNSIDDWPGYGDSGRHVFKHPTPLA